MVAFLPSAVFPPLTLTERSKLNKKQYKYDYRDEIK